MVRRKKELILQKLHSWNKQLGSNLEQSLFKDVGVFYHRQGLSTVLNRAPGYRELYQIYLLLKKGLTITDEPIFRMDYKELTTLYEYWCYIQVIKYFREHTNYELRSQNFIQFTHDQFSVRLKKGESSKSSI